ncbi:MULTISPECIES: twin-arginine translocase TatA/TatE family subunit [Cohnella]|jgi:sec-independent protein translocase protein TatA|uniref:twin-arginine translocase TatA/TatE family subunit n=1 Tax=Cohnella TaxID=329857 RepID=UPI0003AA15A8|nr:MULTISPECIES: twin-arginine translocase TatA/TatE family subunit [Cohnella]REK62568.1 MAG: twin-arginine translocase TatA/TatE family subunit [Cohnella sp.]
MSGIGATGMILLVVVALLLFGPNKLPELGRAVGRTLREFKRGANDIMEDNPSRRIEVGASEGETQAKPEQPKAERRLPE